jgi:hypothetical protein
MRQYQCPMCTFHDRICQAQAGKQPNENAESTRCGDESESERPLKGPPVWARAKTIPLSSPTLAALSGRSPIPIVPR